MKYKKRITMLLGFAILLCFICVDLPNMALAASLSADRSIAAGGTGFNNATTLTLNNSASVSISSDAEELFFKFTPTKNGFYCFESFNNNGDPVASLYNTNQQYLYNDDDSAGSANFRITYHLLNGHTYYFSVGSFDEEGADYQVVLREASSASGLPKTTFLEGVSYSLTNQKYDQMACFTYTPPKTENYTIQSALTSGDPKLWMYRLSGSQFYPITADDNSGADANFKLNSITLVAGVQYYFVVQNTSSAAGSYNVILLKPATIENRFFHIQNVGTSKYLDIHGPNAQEFVHQWTTSTGEQQKWLIQKQQDGYYTIRSQYGDNKYVGISSTNTGVNNIVLSDEITDNTKWKIYVTHNNKYIFEPKTASEGSLYAPNGSTGTEMQLIQTSKGGNKELWNLIAYDYPGLTFAAFDVCDSRNTNEAAYIKQKLEALGYTCVAAYSNDVKTVYGQSIKDIGRYADLVYINGHGHRYADIDILDKNVKGGDYEAIGSFAPDATVNGHSPIYGIGAQWLDDSCTKTDSYWNVRTKWGILAPCAQLDYLNSQALKHWNGLTSAEVWARTMLGDGHRVHGYLGYYDIAPGESAHISRLETFFSNPETYLPSSWAQAHTLLSGSSTWAVLYHSANVSDTLLSMSDADTNIDSESNFQIYYAGRNLGQVTLELQAQNRVDVPDLTSINKNIPKLVSSFSYSRTATQKYAQLQEKLKSTETSILNISEDGRITYWVGNKDWGSTTRSAFSLTDAEAIAAAEKILAELGLLPKDSYQVRVATIDRIQMNLTGGKQQPPETIEYTVCFYRTFAGIDVITDQEDGIVVGISANGLVELRYFWRDMIVETSDERIAVTAITPAQAQSICEKENQMDMKGWYISVAYLQIDESTKPVYVFSTDDCYTNSVYVDIYTGEILTIE